MPVVVSSNLTAPTSYHRSTGGITTLRNGRWKYVHCVRSWPRLFDLQSDPLELVELAADPAQHPELRVLAAELRRVY